MMPKPVPEVIHGFERVVLYDIKLKFHVQINY